MFCYAVWNSRSKYRQGASAGIAVFLEIYLIAESISFQSVALSLSALTSPKLSALVVLFYIEK